IAGSHTEPFRFARVIMLSLGFSRIPHSHKELRHLLSRIQVPAAQNFSEPTALVAFDIQNIHLHVGNHTAATSSLITSQSLLSCSKPACTPGNSIPVRSTSIRLLNEVSRGLVARLSICRNGTGRISLPTDAKISATCCANSKRLTFSTAPR